MDSTGKTKDPVYDARSRIMAAARWGDDAAATEARRDLTAAVLARRIREALAAEPVMTADHRAELIQLLQRGGRA